jgi:hypothetical protein
MEDIHILLLNLFEVCENKHSGSHTLLRCINNCSPISSFISKFGEIQGCKGWFTYSMPRPCRSPALSCCWGFRMCLYHLIYTVWPFLIHTCHALTMPFFSRPRHSTAIERRPVGCLPVFGFFWLPRWVPWSCYQNHANLRCKWPVRNQTFVVDEEKSDSSTLQKKMICYTVGLAVRIFPATTRTFMKGTALSEQGRGMAWHVWINAQHGRGTAWERHGHGMLCVNWP